ncbi:hypothetical protein AAG570_001632 [Ranatra chinensis]|uniref:Uncharacterized protein n=1 Tax=Ranatra chinensis TaxID=642074 RepID=A0ABD0YN43_9HEMI
MGRALALDRKLPSVLRQVRAPLSPLCHPDWRGVSCRAVRSGALLCLSRVLYGGQHKISEAVPDLGLSLSVYRRMSGAAAARRTAAEAAAVLSLSLGAARLGTTLGVARLGVCKQKNKSLRQTITSPRRIIESVEVNLFSLERVNRIRSWSPDRAADLV